MSNIKKILKMKKMDWKNKFTEDLYSLQVPIYIPKSRCWKCFWMGIELHQIQATLYSVPAIMLLPPFFFKPLACLGQIWYINRLLRYTFTRPQSLHETNFGLAWEFCWQALDIGWTVMGLTCKESEEINLTRILWDMVHIWNMLTYSLLDIIWINII